MDESLVAKYPELERSHFWWRTRRELVGRLISDLPFESPAVLDVGCGSGATARALADSGLSVVGVDIDPEMTSTSEQRFHYQCGDFLDLSDDLGEFDVVLALDTVEHFEDEDAVLGAIFANTRPGGFAIVTVPAYDWLWSSHDTENRHFRRYTRGRLKSGLASAGFCVERVGYLFGGLVPPKAVISLWESEKRSVEIAGSPNEWVNRVAGAYFRFETGLAARFPNLLPFGTSVLAVARRTHARPDRPPAAGASTR